MPPSVHEYLQHMLEEALYLMASSQGLDREHFVRDETLKRAFVRSLEVIGEASKGVPESFRQEHPAINWRAMSGMRDRLIHGYLGVDYDIVWDAVTHNIPELENELRHILMPR